MPGFGFCRLPHPSGRVFLQLPDSRETLSIYHAIWEPFVADRALSRELRNVTPSTTTSQYMNSCRSQPSSRPWEIVDLSTLADYAVNSLQNDLHSALPLPHQDYRTASCLPLSRHVHSDKDFVWLWVCLQEHGQVSRTLLSGT